MHKIAAHMQPPHHPHTHTSDSAQWRSNTDAVFLIGVGLQLLRLHTCNLLQPAWVICVFSVRSLFTLLRYTLLLL